MNRRLAADPLQRPGAALSTAGQRFAEELRRQLLAPRRVKGVELVNAEHAAQVAAGQIEQMAWIENVLFPALHPISKYARYVTGVTAAVPSRPVDPAAMLAPHAPRVLPLRPCRLLLDKPYRHP